MEEKYEKENDSSIVDGMHGGKYLYGLRQK